jgi:hypothetical protein
MGSLAKRLEAEVARWPHVSVVPHQFAAREFRFQKAEIGHIHFWGDVDIPFTRAIRDVLVAEGLAQRHRWVPESGWTTFHMNDEADLSRAIWLMRLSYLRYTLKGGSTSFELFQEEAAQMHLDDRLSALLAQFLPVNVGARQSSIPTTTQ